MNHSYSGSASLRYLPVLLGGQEFGIRLEDIVQVTSLQEAQTSGAIQPEDVPLATLAALTVVDLTHLFNGESTDQRRSHVIVVTTSAGMCAFTVDAIRPLRTAAPDARYPVPPLLAASRQFFDTLVRDDNGRLVPILRAGELATRLKMVTPELVREEVHAL